MKILRKPGLLCKFKCFLFYLKIRIIFKSILIKLYQFMKFNSYNKSIKFIRSIKIMALNE